MRLTRPLALAAAVATSALVIAPRQARPCSPLPHPSARVIVIPAAGATDVPTNTRVVVRFDSTPPFAFELVLRPVGGGADIGVSGDPSVPSMALAPNTTYELVDNVQLGSNTPGTLTAFSTFTTGAGPDTTPPAAPTGIVVATATFEDHTGNSCGSYTAVRQQVTFTPSSADGLFVDVITPTARLGRNLGTSGASLFTFCSPDAFGLLPGGVETVAGTHRLRVMDTAGNLSAEATFEADLACPGAGGDGGPGGADSGSGGSGDGDGSGDDSGGCRTAGRPGGAATAWLVLGALAATGPWRRRHRR